MTRKWLLLLATILPFSAFALNVEQAYVRGLPPTQKNTAAFFTLTNPGSEPLSVRAGSSSVAQLLEIHSHGQHNGMAGMRREDSVTLAAGQQLSFQPGGYHLMLINLTRPLRDGDRVQFSLIDDRGAEYQIEAPVRSVLKEAPAGGHHQHHGHGEHH